LALILRFGMVNNDREGCDLTDGLPDSFGGILDVIEVRIKGMLFVIVVITRCGFSGLLLSLGRLSKCLTISEHHFLSDSGTCFS